MPSRINDDSIGAHEDLLLLEDETDELFTNEDDEMLGSSSDDDNIKVTIASLPLPIVEDQKNLCIEEYPIETIGSQKQSQPGSSATIIPPSKVQAESQENRKTNKVFLNPHFKHGGISGAMKNFMDSIANESAFLPDSELQRKQDEFIERCMQKRPTPEADRRQKRSQERKKH